MITIITGKPGVGKTALNTYFCVSSYYTDGMILKKQIIKKISELKTQTGKEYTMPEAPPLYTNYPVRLNVGYKKWYEPYYINPYYLGLSNTHMETQYVPPYSRIFISEAQRYYDSRKSANFPGWVSRFYEMHRHYHLEIYLDVQRGRLIDLNIRELCKRFIEVQRLENQTTKYGEIIGTRWYCREFYNMQDYDEYINGGECEYTETEYAYEGNIYECYNSYSSFVEFLPQNGQDFSYLPYKQPGEVSANKFYEPDEPEAYRNPAKTETNK